MKVDFGSIERTYPVAAQPDKLNIIFIVLLLPSQLIRVARSISVIEKISIALSELSQRLQEIKTQLEELDIRIIERNRAKEMKCMEKSAKAADNTVSNDVSFVYSITRVASRDVRFIRIGRLGGQKIRCCGTSKRSPFSQTGGAGLFFFISRFYGAPFIKSAARCGPTTLFSARLKVDIASYRSRVYTGQDEKSRLSPMIDLIVVNSQ